MREPTSGKPVAIETIDVWTFRLEPALGNMDLTGFTVEATDGKIGKIDEATYDAGSSYLIVDTGPWIFGKKVMLPASVVDQVDPETETVFVNRSKDEIKGSPEYDDDRGAGDDAYRQSLGGYYSGAR